MDDLHRELTSIHQTGLRSLLKLLHRLESIPDQQLTPELRQWRDEQRVTLREDLMKVAGDDDGRKLRTLLRRAA